MSLQQQSGKREDMKIISLEIKADDDMDEVEINEIQEKILERFKVNAVHVSKIEEYRESYSIVDEFGQI